MVKWSALVLVAIIAGLAATTLAADKQKQPRDPLAWMEDYAEAMQTAKDRQKMLLVHFSEKNSGMSAAIERSLAQPQMRKRLDNYVLARVPLGATIQSGGKPVRVIDHPAFSELRGGTGLAVIDLAHKKRPYYERVVSALPTTSGRFYQFRPEHLPTLLDLPAGTLTQRTMIFAVRTHNERPASTTGEADPVLLDEATQHSTHQARVRASGHHGWGGRFQRIIGRLTGRGRYSAPVEIVAESWPGQDLNDACHDCVQSWRQSGGHWSKVRAHHASYGYDIQRGPNGIWYATGIFAN
jgi:hypothetical protein